MLPIHTIHKLLELLSIQGAEEDVKKFKRDLIKLESLFLKSYSSAVIKCKLEFEEVVKTINYLSDKITPDRNWFREIIYKQEDSRIFFSKMKKHVEAIYGDQVFENQ